MSSKIDVIKTLLEKADKVIIVGGMVFTFDKAEGRKVRTYECALHPEELLLWSYCGSWTESQVLLVLRPADVRNRIVAARLGRMAKWLAASHPMLRSVARCCP